MGTEQELIPGRRPTFPYDPGAGIGGQDGAEPENKLAFAQGTFGIWVVVMGIGGWSSEALLPTWLFLLPNGVQPSALVTACPERVGHRPALMEQ